MHVVSKYSSTRRIGWGWIAGGVVVVMLIAGIGLILVLGANQVKVVPPTPLSQEQLVPALPERTEADLTVRGSGPFGAHGFDSLLPSKPAATEIERIGSGHYPFGAHGFDSLLPSKPAATEIERIGSGHYPFGAHGFDSLLADER